jgi:hypothetical protein
MPEDAKPASFVNIAFDSGVIAERNRIIKLLTIKYAELIKANKWKESNYYLEITTLIREETK